MRDKKWYITSLIFFIVLLNWFIFVSTVSAHAIGQPPYFKANGVFTDYYPVPSKSLENFQLPQDIVTEQIIINQEISFEIDKNALPIPEEVVKKTKFIWDFGDGEKAEGLKNIHSYSKPGTYFLNIYADSGGGFGEGQLLQSTAVNIKPYKEYVLPRAVIEVNGKQTADPLVDIKDVNFLEEIRFDGRNSEKGSSEIVSYEWDLGDANKKDEAAFTYLYRENPYTVFPVLRIKTSDGFISDAFIQIRDGEAITFAPKKVTDSGQWRNSWVVIVICICLAFLGGLVLVVMRFLKKGQ